MRASLILLAALAACSDSSGPHQVPVLTTQLSATVDSINGRLEVTLNASNPTDTTLHLSFTLPSVYAAIKVGGQWTYGSGFAAFTSTDTLSLTSGATATLGTVNVIFLPPAGHLSVAPAILPNDEYFTLSPGTYSVRACYDPIAPGTQAGSISQAACGNGVSLTLTP